MNDNNIIIGGGPAGIATAITIKRYGGNCCVLESKQFPRNKACGGLITAKTVSLLNILLENKEAFYREASLLHKVYVSSNRGILFDYHCSVPFYTISRLSLDNILVEQYKIDNGVIVENCRCINVNQERRIISTTEGEYNYSKVVIAAGAGHGIKGIRDSPIRTGLGGMSIVDLDGYKNDGIHLTIGYIKQGYSWVFPQHGDSFNVGFAGNLSAQSYQIALNDMMKRYGVTKQDIVWGRIPINQTPVIKAKEGLFYIGSSNGMVDSLTGEGIFFAYLSGISTGLFLVNKISYNEYIEIMRYIRFLVRGGTFSSTMLWKYKLLSVLLVLGKHLKKLDSHMTDYLISKYDYNHYNALLAPIICYTNLNAPSEKRISTLKEWAV